MKYSKKNLIIFFISLLISKVFCFALYQNSSSAFFAKKGNFDNPIEYYAFTQDEERINYSYLVDQSEYYSSLGQYQKSIEYEQEALAMAQDQGWLPDIVSSLERLSTAHQNLGEYHEAIDYREQKLAVLREMDDRLGEAGALSALADILSLGLGEHTHAIQLYQQSLEISIFVKQYGEPINHIPLQAALMEWSLRYKLAYVYLRMGDHSQSLNILKENIEIARDRESNGMFEAVGYDALGAVLLYMNRLPESEQALLKSLSIWEVILDNMYSSLDMSRVRIFDLITLTHSKLQQVQVKQRKISQALETSEKGRSRVLEEILSNHANSDFKALNLNEIKQVAMERNITIVEYSIVQNFVPEIAELSFEEQIEKNEYSLYTWVLKPTGEIFFREISLTSFGINGDADFRNLVQVTRELIGVRGNRTDASPEIRTDVIASRRADTDRKLRLLNQILIEPITDIMPSDSESKVIFIPQKSLLSVPFPALKDKENKYLIEKHTILVSPSIQTFKIASNIAKERQDNDAMIIGNPIMPAVRFLSANGVENIQLRSLPGAQQEAEAIGKILKSPALTGDLATEFYVKSNIENASILHFATHGLLEYDDSFYINSSDAIPGAIALAPGNGEDGLLTSKEIINMNLSADLVVLSACDTGNGQITGEGLIGLSRSFISTGVPSVIASLWQIPDTPTAALMTEFYKQRKKTGDNAKALRHAMLSTMETYPEPKNWAAFTLIGSAN